MGTSLWRWIVVALAGLLLMGCLPVTTKTPVGTTTGLGADKALYGSWTSRNPDEPDSNGYVHFLMNKDGSITALMVNAQGDTGDSWSIFRVRTSKLGANRYMNAELQYDKGEAVRGEKKGANIPLLYVRKGKTLTLYLLDEKKIKAAIRSGRIKGQIEPGDNGDALIAGSAAELDAFFARSEVEDLFKPMLVLRKVD
jgi:hypothetical protein